MNNQKKNLIVNYLPTDLTEDELTHLFSVCGEVRKARIIRDGRTQNSLGYGFVVFKTTCGAVAAQILMDGHKIRGKTLKVAFARPRGEDIKNANLYVSFLPRNVNEEELEKLFGKCGKIIETKILRDKVTGVSRGVGFIRFNLHADALKARNILNFHCFPGTTKPISVKFRPSFHRNVEPVEEATDSSEISDPKEAILQPSGEGDPGSWEHPTNT